MHVRVCKHLEKPLLTRLLSFIVYKLYFKFNYFTKSLVQTLIMINDYVFSMLNSCCLAFSSTKLTQVTVNDIKLDFSRF